MPTFLSPLGYDSTRVTRPILSEGVRRGDRVVLLRPIRETDDQRATEAIEDVKRILAQIEPEVELDTVQLESSNLEQAVFTCSDLIVTAAPDVVVSFGGGAREIYMALSVATLAHLEIVEKTILFSDITGEVRDAPLPDLTANLNDSELNTLEVIVKHDEGLVISEIEDSVDFSKSSIVRHVGLLEEIGAVETEMHGKTKHAMGTFTGRLLVRKSRPTAHSGR